MKDKDIISEAMRLLGQRTSERKRASSRENIKKGRVKRLENKGKLNVLPNEPPNKNK